MTAHTVDEALARFDLVSGSGDRERTACAMTAISWIAGDAWSDHPACAHRLLADLVIRANDAPPTTPEQRAAIVRAGEQGLIDTWWVPDEVVLGCLAESRDHDPVTEVLGTIALVAWWKVDRQRPDLRGADLRCADLCGANLRGADLRGANLRGANLCGANLRGANLRGANLRGANLRGAILRDADLRGAILRDADLRGAILRDADHGPTWWPDGFDRGRLS